MSQQELLHFVSDLLPAWRKTRRVVLALGSCALVRRRRLTLCGIARGLDSRTRVKWSHGLGTALSRCVRSSGRWG